MTKSNITEYDNTAANNTDVEDVPLGENLMYPSHVNNAFREMMADLADVNDGTVALTSPSATALDVTNNITVGGTVDGRDVATDGTKLDGIEAAADVTDTTNVTAAGAAMLTGATFTGSITATEATFSGNTSVKLPAGTEAQRPTGVNGMLRYNSDEDQFEGYADGEWGAIAGGGETSFLQYNYTATAGQTTFSGADDNSATLSYTASNLMVTLNGILLENGTDYTATNGTSIVLTDAAALDDELNVVAFKTFVVADTVPASTGGTFTGNVGVTGNITVDGTVDGRDLAADGTKLDGIEASADATDANNVGAALTTFSTGTDAVSTDLVPYYDVSSGAWEKSTVSNLALVGPTGATGATGATGPSGPSYLKLFGRYNGSSNSIAHDVGISSLTDVTTGNHNVNFSFTVTNTFTATAAGGDSSNNAGRVCNPFDGGSYSTSYVNIRTATGGNSAQNVEFVNVAVFR